MALPHLFAVKSTTYTVRGALEYLSNKSRYLSNKNNMLRGIFSSMSLAGQMFPAKTDAFFASYPLVQEVLRAIRPTYVERPSQGVTKCQNNPSFSLQVAVSPVTVAKQCLNALSSSVLCQHRKVKQSAVSMGGRLQDREHQKADDAALQLKPHTALKRAKREPNGHRVCVGFVS